VGAILLNLHGARDESTVGEQAVNQLIAIGITLAIAVAGGACSRPWHPAHSAGTITGLNLRFLRPIVGQVRAENLYSDENFWLTPDDFEKREEDGDKYK